MTNKPPFRGERVRLGNYVVSAGVRNKGARNRDVYSVTNSRGFVPSTEYFNKEVFSKELSSYRLVERGMIAYNPSRINVGSVALQDVKDEVVVSPLYVVFSVDRQKLLPEYLLRYLKSQPGLEQIKFRSTGTVRNNLKIDGLRQIEIAIPSVVDQQDRVNKLGAVECRITEANSMLNMLDDLVKSRFVELFGDTKFETETIESLAVSMRNGLSPSKGGETIGRVLTLSAITQGRFNPDAWKAGTFNGELPKDKTVIAGDFLICRGNGNKSLVGVGQYSATDIPNCVFPDTIIAVTVDQGKVLLPYLRQAWTMPQVRKQLESTARTTNGTHKINQKGVGAVSIPVPPLALQQEFADFVAEVDKSRLLVQKQIDKLQTLYDSLAQDYFG